MGQVWNIRDPRAPKDALYIGRSGKGRSGKWGNPFQINKPLTRSELNKITSRLSEIHNMRQYSVGQRLDRDQVIELYAAYFQWANMNRHLDPSELVQKDDNGGFEPKDMVCFCKPAACHGDYLQFAARQFINEIMGKAPGCTLPCEFACTGESCMCSDLQHQPF